MQVYYGFMYNNLLFPWAHISAKILLKVVLRHFTNVL